MAKQSLSPAADLLERLAQPEPVGPTDEELKSAYWEAFVDAAPCGADESWLAGLRAVARLSHPTLTPIPVSERPILKRDPFNDQGRVLFEDYGDALAAALRVAADRMMSLIGDICHPKYMEGIEAASDFLEHIAAELEDHR